MTQEQLIELLQKMVLSDRLDVIAIVISSLAFLASIIGLVQQKRLNSANLQAKYFETIFQDFFINRIPDCAIKLDFNKDGKINQSYRELNSVLMEMVRKSAYFAYAKNEFYEELRERTKNLDEKLVIMAGEKELDERKQKEFIFSVHQDIKDIVKLVNKNYHSF